MFLFDRILDFPRTFVQVHLYLVLIIGIAKTPIIPTCPFIYISTVYIQSVQ